MYVLISVFPMDFKNGIFNPSHGLVAFSKMLPNHITPFGKMKKEF